MLGKILGCMTRLATICWMAFAIVISYWWFLDNPEPVLIHSVTITKDGPMRAGDTVQLHVDLCQVRPGVPGTGVRMLRSIGTLSSPAAPLYFFPENYIFPDVGCTNHTRDMQLPLDIAPGDYEYIFQGLYQINPIRQHVFTQRPIKIEIVK